MSVYAFSIENFRRSEEEVEALMRLAEEKLCEIAERLGDARDKGVRVRVLGDLALLPAGVRSAAARAEAATAANEGATLNICLSYTARHEIAQAVHRAAGEMAVEAEVPSAGDGGARAHCACAQGAGAQDAGAGKSADGAEGLIERALMTDADAPVDLLIRTSGETRLSDFMLWQVGFAVLVFMDVLWHDFSFRHLLWALLQYQRHAEAAGDAREAFRANTAQRDDAASGVGEDSSGSDVA